jgi:Tol biopolymer transport system component
VWSGLEDGNRDVYVKSIDKDDLRRLSTDTWIAFTPVWSPDGKHIAYVRRAPDGSDNRVMIAGTEPGSGERVAAMVVDHQGFVGLAWWPDSSAVILRDAGAKGRPLVRIDIYTGEKQPITHPEDAQDSLPVVSPNGKRLLFARVRTGFRSICVLPLGPDTHKAAETCHERNRLSYSAAWREDSATILFREARTLWEARFDEAGRLGTPVKVADGDFGQLTNDSQGKRFAFSRNYSDTNILQVEAGSNKRPVRLFASSEEDSEPEFSPDGSQILFRSARLGHYELYVASRDGSGLRQLTRLGTHVGSARWSPDGQWVVFDGSLLPLTPGSKGPPMTRFTNIYVIPASGGTGV